MNKRYNLSARTSETLSYKMDISRGALNGFEALFLSGKNNSIDSGTSEDIWESGGLYPFPSTATTVRVVSSSANDATGGTGANSILIMGLNSDYNRIQEVIELNGTTAVQSSKSFLRINRVIVATVGSTSRNQGNITIRGGTQGTDPIVGYIDQYNGISHSAIYTVPAGKTLFLLQSIVNLAKKQAAEGLLVLETRQPNGPWITSSFINLTSEGTNSFVRDTIIPGTITEKSDVKYRLVSTNVNGLTVSVSADYVLRDDDVINHYI